MFLLNNNCHKENLLKLRKILSNIHKNTIKHSIFLVTNNNSRKANHLKLHKVLKNFKWI